MTHASIDDWWSGEPLALETRGPRDGAVVDFEYTSRGDRVAATQECRIQ